MARKPGIVSTKPSFEIVVSWTKSSVKLLTDEQATELVDRINFPAKPPAKSKNIRQPTASELLLAANHGLDAADPSFVRRLAVRAACGHQQDTPEDMPLERAAKKKVLNGWFSAIALLEQKRLVALSRAVRSTEAVVMARQHTGRAIQPRMFRILDISKLNKHSKITEFF